jgi:hypothetical protein
LIKVSNDSTKNNNKKRTFNLLEINKNNRDFLNKLDSSNKKEDFYYYSLIKNNLNSTKQEKIMTRKSNKEKKKEDKNWTSLKKQIDYFELYIILIITNIIHVYKTKVNFG